MAVFINVHKASLDHWFHNWRHGALLCLCDAFLDYVKKGMTVTVKEDGVVVVE